MNTLSNFIPLYFMPPLLKWLYLPNLPPPTFLSVEIYVRTMRIKTKKLCESRLSWLLY